MNSLYTTAYVQQFFVRFSIKEQTLFAKKLSFLMGAEIPIVECLAMLQAQATSKSKEQALDDVVRSVANGQLLSVSLGKHPRLFSDFFITLVRVGEQSGTLHMSLVHLAQELKKKHTLRTKVLSALVYPTCIFIGTIVVTILLLVYIFPKILPIFASLAVQLPFSTRLVLALSDFLVAFGVWCLLGVGVAIGVLCIARNTYAGVRWYVDATILRMPLMRHMVCSYNRANVCRTLGLLLKSGMRLGDALAVTAQGTRHVLYKHSLLELCNVVQQGGLLSSGFAQYPKLFSHITTQLVAVGEKTGTLAASLAYASDLHEGEVEEQTKQLAASIEPVLMVLMGLTVGFVAIAIITPLYEITAHLTPR